MHPERKIKNLCQLEVRTKAFSSEGKDYWPGLPGDYLVVRVEKTALYDILKIIQMRQQIVGTRDVDYGQE